MAVTTFLKNIAYLPVILLHDFNRNLHDYLGSLLVKKYIHSSKKIRRFKNDDLARILELDKLCFLRKDYYQIKKYSKLFRNTFFIYEENDIIVAYFGFYIHLQFVDFTLIQKATAFSLCVHPQQQHKGIMKTIYLECLSELKNNNVTSVSACIQVNNTTSLNVHKNLGFFVVDKNTNVCGDDFLKVELKL